MLNRLLESGTLVYALLILTLLFWALDKKWQSELDKKLSEDLADQINRSGAWVRETFMAKMQHDPLNIARLSIKLMVLVIAGLCFLYILEPKIKYAILAVSFALKMFFAFTTITRLRARLPFAIIKIINFTSQLVDLALCISVTQISYDLVAYVTGLNMLIQ